MNLGEIAEYDTKRNSPWQIEVGSGSTRPRLRCSETRQDEESWQFLTDDSGGPGWTLVPFLKLLEDVGSWDSGYRPIGTADTGPVQERSSAMSGLDDDDGQLWWWCFFETMPIVHDPGFWIRARLSKVWRPVLDY
jgi:hypothetical protein